MPELPSNIDDIIESVSSVYRQGSFWPQYVFITLSKETMKMFYLCIEVIVQE